MAWNCTLYSNFKKRLNSTKQPTGGTTYACRIKNNTDFINPTFEISAADLSAVNYMQFNGSYYYVTNVVSHRTGIWDVTGRRDSMATYKSDIEQTRSLVLYGQTGTDVGGAAYRVPDERIPITRTPAQHITSVPVAGNFNVSPTGGSYILSAVGESNGVVTYVVSQSNMSALITGLNQDVLTRAANYFEPGRVPVDPTDALTLVRNGLYYIMSQELAYGNYAQCIKSCYWIPFDGFSGGAPKTIYLGDYNTGVTGLVFGTKVISQYFDVAIPWNNVDDWKRNNFILNLYLPFCGTVVIPVDKAIDASSVHVDMSLDVVGGTLAYRVAVGVDTLIVTGANVGAAYAIGSSNVTMSNVMQGASQAVGGGINAAMGIGTAMATGGAMGAGGIASGITSVASGIGQAITPQVQSVGSMGGLASAGLLNYIRLEALYYEPISDLNFRHDFGYPSMITRIPGDGYNMCRGFSVECAGTPEEKAEINAYFNTGAYLE